MDVYGEIRLKTVANTVADTVAGCSQVVAQTDDGKN